MIFPSFCIMRIAWDMKPLRPDNDEIRKILNYFVKSVWQTFSWKVRRNTLSGPEPINSGSIQALHIIS